MSSEQTNGQRPSKSLVQLLSNIHLNLHARTRIQSLSNIPETNKKDNDNNKKKNNPTQILKNSEKYFVHFEQLVTCSHTLTYSIHSQTQGCKLQQVLFIKTHGHSSSNEMAPFVFFLNK